MQLPILYQDEFIVAIDKPANLLVHRSMIDKHETKFAMQMVRDQIGQHVFPLHRLDRPTSGVLLFALSSEAARQLNEQWVSRKVKKQYCAIVRGHTAKEARINYPLKEKLDKIADRHASTNKAPQEAITGYETMAHFELPHAVGRYATARYSFVKLIPETGRKHQLRRHMAHISHPIIGDTTHGDGKQNKFIRDQFGFHGLALTCQAMRIFHPVMQCELHIQTGLDERIKKLLACWGWSPDQINQPLEIE